MVAATVGDYTGAAPFHTCYMTVSGHLRYTFGGNFIARKNRDLVAACPSGNTRAPTWRPRSNSTGPWNCSCRNWRPPAWPIAPSSP